jgi:hypothetical protein
MTFNTALNKVLEYEQPNAEFNAMFKVNRILPKGKIVKY